MYGDDICGTVGDSGREREHSGRGYWKIIATIVAQHEPGTG
jgi:hypothetical protein